MRKLFFLFALLASMTASATVTVTPLGVDYNTKTVKFSVSWTGDAVNNRVWVWIDYCPVTGISPGAFAKAEIGGATATAGSITTVAGNTRGFYVTTSPSTVTATLNNATGNFNWCVYGNDAPPKVTADNGTYTLYGTPPFILTAAGSTTTQTVAATTIATSAVTITPVTLTDETGCPGVFCIYTGNDLYIDGTHLCQQRAGGDKNWEAYIKDTRDDELYRIVLMPDNNWWLAESMHYDASSSKQSYKCPNKAQHTIYNYPSVACPAGWTLPSVANYNALVSAATFERLKATGVCTGTDYYGYSITSDQYNSNNANDTYPSGNCLNEYPLLYMVQTSNQQRYHFGQSTTDMSCDVWGHINMGTWNEARCLRQL